VWGGERKKVLYVATSVPGSKTMTLGFRVLGFALSVTPLNAAVVSVSINEEKRGFIFKQPPHRYLGKCGQRWGWRKKPKHSGLYSQRL